MLITLATPPLRGPDEIAHFLRIYSYAKGELLPAAEVDGRKGTLVERTLYNQLSYFKAAGEWFAAGREQGVRYGQIMAAYPGGAADDDDLDLGTRFAAFAGTEGYSPVAYLPYIIAAAIGHQLGLDFPDLLLLMRMFGLIAFTAVAGYAISVTPALKWAFVLIGLLPVSLFNRSVLSADGAALSSALVVTALCLSAVQSAASARLRERSLWMTLCALTKQPQIVFVLLEPMAYRLKQVPPRWRHIAIVVLPPLILSPLWVVAISGEIAAWRLQESESHPPEHFDPLWKLQYMWEHPSHFPLAAWTAVVGWGDRLWLELIGILGWQDISFPSWVYVALTILLLLASLEKLHLSGETRARVTVTTGFTVLSYVIVVYLIFFLTYTPLDVDHVRGVQGRYFVIILPALALFIAGLINLELPRDTPAAAAMVGSIIAGAGSVAALLQAHWLGVMYGDLAAPS